MGLDEMTFGVTAGAGSLIEEGMLFLTAGIETIAAELFGTVLVTRFWDCVSVAALGEAIAECFEEQHSFEPQLAATKNRLLLKLKRSGLLV